MSVHNYTKIKEKDAALKLTKICDAELEKVKELVVDILDKCRIRYEVSRLRGFYEFTIGGNNFVDKIKLYRPPVKVSENLHSYIVDACVLELNEHKYTGRYQERIISYLVNHELISETV